MNQAAELPAHSVLIIPADKDHAVYVMSTESGDWGPNGTAIERPVVLIAGDYEKLSVEDFDGEEIEVYHEGTKG